MSLTAMHWALHFAPITTPRQHLVLLALAARADDDGRNASTTRAMIARDVRCSLRTVQTALNELRDAGLIRRGDQRLVDVDDHRADLRTVVWDLDLTRTEATR